MLNFRRYYIPNAIVFITCVNQDRAPFLRAEADIKLFFETLRNVQQIHPFRLLAYVILLDHFHWLMYVEKESGNFSDVLQSIKRNFTLNYKDAHHIPTPLKLWQSRFWDHIICDEKDLERHFDYIHWNPVKHGYVHRPEDWPHSPYIHWSGLTYYQPDWGWEGEPANIRAMDYE